MGRNVCVCKYILSHRGYRGSAANQLEKTMEIKCKPGLHCGLQGEGTVITRQSSVVSSSQSRR